MLRVDSAKPCESGAQQFEVWTHHYVPGPGGTNGGVAFNKFTLLARESENIRGVLGLPEVDDPYALFALAKNVPWQAKRLSELGAPAITSVVQICNRAAHQDYTRTASGTGRMEA